MKKIRKTCPYFAICLCAVWAALWGSGAAASMEKGKSTGTGAFLMCVQTHMGEQHLALTSHEMEGGDRFGVHNEKNHRHFHDGGLMVHLQGLEPWAP